MFIQQVTKYGEYGSKYLFRRCNKAVTNYGEYKGTKIAITSFIDSGKTEMKKYVISNSDFFTIVKKVKNRNGKFERVV